MSKRVLILVEGQTEERFVKDVLGPSFFTKEIFFQATILMTKRVKDGTRFKGGVTNFAKFENDARRLLESAGDALVTTMLDYYGLPSDFPGMDSRPVPGNPLRRVTHVENAMSVHFGSRSNFLPFLALHEFEAWLFSSPTELPRVMTEPGKQIEFESVCSGVGTPEDINERPELAPSKRITAMFPAYKKTLHGPTTADRIGLEKIRKECPHFNDWMKKVEAFACS
ncbi:MAG: hypothetical protein JWN25_2364 [Verrucomicrobiales bacterium]|nr:hypothetical protein [Verrucomicrobiales bacterium]MDB6131687.1 hypothetical protein [Verrucomicrobiales bacterium]